MPYFASPHTAQIDPFVAALLQAAAAAQQQQQAHSTPAPAPSRSNTRSGSKQSSSQTSTHPHPQPSTAPSKKPQNRSLRAFSPNFDVYETEAAYHLEGELPGLFDKSAVDIEFSDDRTLLVRGRISRVSPAAKEEEGNKRRSLNPTVEDTDDEDELEHGHTIVKHDDKKQKTEEEVEERKIWLSERTFGPFQRTFSFPTPVDPEKTTATLEAGVLSIEVPKHVFQGVRKIQVM